VIYYYKRSFNSDRIDLDVSSPAFRFGMGFFETLFYNGRMVCHLDAHVARIEASLSAFQLAYEKVDFADVVRGVLEQNGLQASQARINIYYILEAESVAASPLIAAYPYSHEHGRVFRLGISPYHHISHLCTHKTMNYMHFYLAKLEAMRRGFDDALITDPNGRIQETSTASLVFGDGETMFSPEAGARLPGIAMDVACTILHINERKVTIADLRGYPHAYVLNSLIGMKPVIRIDDITYTPDWSSCSRLSEQVLRF
jgi:4-amino-4-deoxychorismate lyase